MPYLYDTSTSSKTTKNPLLDAMPMIRNRAPGGAFPEGWEFFKPAFQACWFVRQIRPQKFTIFGICPCKTPLDAHFDHRRRQLREHHEKSLISHNSQPLRVLSKEERTMLERQRETSERYCGSWHPEDIRWCLGDFWGSGKEEAANVRAVINLCATERYYDGNAFEAEGIDYIWHKTEGGGHVPSAQDLWSIRQLLEQLEYKYSIEIAALSLQEVQAHIRQRCTALPLILLHCTHGVNRTGFTVAAMALLYDARLRVGEAIDAFGRVRGHYINRPELEQALYDLFEAEESKEGIMMNRGSGVVLWPAS